MRQVTARNNDMIPTGQKAIHALRYMRSNPPPISATATCPANSA
jgi:hypothetical protein